MSETGDKVVSDEERVRAAWPNAYHDYPPVVGGGLCRIRTGVYPNPGIGEGCDLDNAWAAATKHPSVAAFEAQHRPASPKAVRDYTCGACKAEFTSCTEPRHPMYPYCGGDGIEEEDRVSQPLALGPQKSGKLLLRIPKSIHAQAEKIAEAEGVSLNQWLSTSIAMIVARAALGQAVVPQDRLEAIAADSFCEHAECSTDSAKVGVCAACDAIYAARECLRLRASIKPEAPRSYPVSSPEGRRLLAEAGATYGTIMTGNYYRKVIERLRQK